MEVIYLKSFLKLYGKLPLKIQQKFESSITIFHSDPFNVQLHNHLLIGKWKGFRSIDVTGDYRAVYASAGKNIAKFYAIGTHSQLYK